MMKVDKPRIEEAQVGELRAIKAEMDLHPELTFTEVMDRRPPYIGWIDENGNVRESPRMAIA
jgi:hypothetical protein